MNNKDKRAAYKATDVTQMSYEQLRCVLITSDGRGDCFKERALDELLKRVGASDGEKTGTAEQG